jgi:hypothetical protein
MTTYLKHPQPSPDKNAGRSATQVSDRHAGGGQMGSSGSMGKGQDTGDGMENEKGVSGGKKKAGKMSY